MQTINLELNGKSLRFAYGECDRITPVGDNSDYFISFEIDERRAAMFAMFVRDRKQEAVLIDENGSVNIPLWALKCPGFEVGVVSDGFASRPLYIRVIGSIIDKKHAPATPPDRVLLEQLTELINKLKEDRGEIDIGNGLQYDKDSVLSVKMAEKIEAGNTLPVSSDLVHTEIGNINALLSTI